ncbi:MAG: CvpA family protein [Cytophagales bacterium]|nr:CvpA family protein [Cytophagales bacterium]
MYACLGLIPSNKSIVSFSLLLDILLIGFLLWFGNRGRKKGFVLGLISFFLPLLSFGIAYYLFFHFPNLSTYAGVTGIYTGLTILACWIASWICLRILGSWLRGLLRMTPLGGLDSLLGWVLGLLKGLGFLIILLYMFYVFFGTAEEWEVWNGSRVYNFLLAILRRLGFLPHVS